MILSVDAFKTAWGVSFKKFDQFARASDKKVIFSEFGFVNKKYSTMQPWVWDGCMEYKEDGKVKKVLAADRPVDSQERANATHALSDIVAEGKVPWLDGILF
jgi:hypothetical protein